MQSRARSSYAEPQPSLAVHLNALQRYGDFLAPPNIAPRSVQISVKETTDKKLIIVKVLAVALHCYSVTVLEMLITPLKCTSIFIYLYIYIYKYINIGLNFDFRTTCFATVTL